MRPILDDLELPQVQEILTHDLRRLAEHKPPGMPGSLLQNLGRKPTGIVLWGFALGSNAKPFLESLAEKFKAGDPLSFTGDIVADAEIEQVVIDDLKWEEVAGKPDRYAYLLTLREYIEPTEPEDLSLLENEILEDAAGIMDDVIDAIDLLPFFETGLDQFVEPMSNFLDELQELPDDGN